jgi:hypothetical protein
MADTEAPSYPVNFTVALTYIQELQVRSSAAASSSPTLS